ncbi:MAG: glutamate-cysteine ligase family protein [Deferribacterales bacterium]
MGRYNLFEGYGIEIEYMIVDRDTLKVRPVADKLLEKLAGELVNEVFIDGIGYSNELVKHVIEIKTEGPQKYKDMADNFSNAVDRINGILAEMNCMIMPTAMHPTMNPLTETELWQDENAEIYEAYDRIFNCKGHGWSNLQSVHINMPFNGDDQFEKLHAAIRCVLPIIPALCASSPMVEGTQTGLADNRLDFYRNNQRSVPFVAGNVIPERVFSEAEYNEKIFDELAKAIAPHDPEEILEPIWLNSRGAIARFDRGAVEIRLVDVQECPQADIAVVKLISETVRHLSLTGDLEKMKKIDEAEMYTILLSCIREGENALVSHKDLLDIYGMPEAKAVELWRAMFLRTGMDADKQYAPALLNIFSHGTLSTRIKEALISRSIEAVYAELCGCLKENELFNG